MAWLGATATVESIFAEFENEPALGIVCPPAFPLIEPHLSWGDVKERCEDLLTRMNIDPALPDVPDSSPQATCSGHAAQRCAP